MSRHPKRTCRKKKFHARKSESETPGGEQVTERDFNPSREPSRADGASGAPRNPLTAIGKLAKKATPRILLGSGRVEGFGLLDHHEKNGAKWAYDIAATFWPSVQLDATRDQRDLINESEKLPVHQ